jgi:hypothetical protein
LSPCGDQVTPTRGRLVIETRPSPLNKNSSKVALFDQFMAISLSSESTYFAWMIISTQNNH